MALEKIQNKKISKLDIVVDTLAGKVVDIIDGVKKGIDFTKKSVIGNSLQESFEKYSPDSFLTEDEREEFRLMFEEEEAVELEEIKQSVLSELKNARWQRELKDLKRFMGCSPTLIKKKMVYDPESLKVYRNVIQRQRSSRNYYWDIAKTMGDNNEFIGFFNEKIYGTYGYYMLIIEAALQYGEIDTEYFAKVLFENYPNFDIGMYMNALQELRNIKISTLIAYADLGSYAFCFE